MARPTSVQISNEDGSDKVDIIDDNGVKRLATDVSFSQASIKIKDTDGDELKITPAGEALVREQNLDSDGRIRNSSHLKGSDDGGTTLRTLKTDADGTLNIKIVSDEQIGNFGKSYAQNSSESESSTTSSTFQQKVRLTTPSLPSGTYRIGFYYEWQKTGLTDFKSQVQVNDSITIMEGFEESVDSGNDQWFPRSGFGLYTGSGVLDIDLDYAANGDTSKIRRARLEIWRVN